MRGLYARSEAPLTRLAKRLTAAPSRFVIAIRGTARGRTSWPHVLAPEVAWVQTGMMGTGINRGIGSRSEVVARAWRFGRGEAANVSFIQGWSEGVPTCHGITFRHITVRSMVFLFRTSGDT